MKTFWDELVIEFGGGNDVVVLPGASVLLNKIIHKLQRQALIPYLEVSSGVSLDVGSGIGRWTSILGEKAHFAIGLDISKRMTQIAKRRVRKANVDFIVATATAIPIRSNTVDFVLSCACLQHIVEENKHEEAIHEIARISRGKIVVLELMSKKDKVKYNHYPTLILPKSKYLSLLVGNGAKVIGHIGVDFLPFHQLLEQVRDFFLMRFNINVPLYVKVPKRMKHMCKAYNLIALFAVLVSLPFDALLRNCLKDFTRHSILIAKMSK